ncbi:hypothetical protein OGCDGJMD_02590 [Cyanobium usitatum str. Tous]|uniref:M10 family metallopeptidase C-terminal domain-containing protein n=1 Tax=Cyanobium usitatum TaxID=2304190 RepID=UPI002AD25E26|nr:M10 family metallopeptidase C-terminal domain-containing protein [Cyanobium usitatum]CAK6699099.1 hypothetical protein OGCDGJMD_02590 [Cyanobium usitatum str. Tous]
MANLGRFEPEIPARASRPEENFLGTESLFMAGFKAEFPTRASDALAAPTSVEPEQRDIVTSPGALLAAPVARDALTVALARVTAISSDSSVSDDSIDLDAIDSRFHAGRCVCMACNGAGRSPMGEVSVITTPTGSTASAAANAPVSLQTLANYLTRDFWLEAGTYSRRYNLSSSGNGANNGTITYNVTGWGNDIDGLSSDRRTLTREVFKLYSATLGINFQEVTGSGGDIRFTDNDSGAYAYTATGWYADSSKQDLIIDYSVVNVQASWDNSRSNYNTYTPQTIFHEIGHALGLGHQGQYNYTGTPLTYAVSAQFANDSWQATMMSYWDQAENTTTGASFAWLQTPMAVDWMALNDLYGTQGYSTASAFQGDTIYGVGTNITAAQSQIWNLFSTYAGSTAHTIVDGDGYDTLNVSNFSANQLINLAPSQSNSTAPSISNIGGKIGNLTIAAGTIIEAAIGGSGNDSFYGNDVNNSFRGGGGNDSFYDSLGSDTYYGDEGIDWLYFSESIELLSYALSDNSLLFSRTSGSFDVDQVWNSVENIVFNSISFSYADLVSSLSGPVLADVTISSVNGLLSGAATSSTDLSFSGSLSQALDLGQSIAFYRDGLQLGSADVSATDPTSWSISLQESAGSNSFAYTARLVDSTSGKLGSLSSPFALTVDTVAPLVSVNALTTEDTTPLLSGTISEAAAQVSVSIGGISRSAINNGNGTWSLQWSDPLAAGPSYNVVVTATDAAGNSGTDTTTGELSILVPPPQPSPVLFFSLSSAVTSSSASVMGGLTAQRNDIIAFDGSSFSTWLNGNASGLSGAVLRDFHIVSPDEVVVAFQSPITLSGTAFDDSDLARLSRNTSGGFDVSMFFDGSDVGLTTKAEKIDAVTGLPDGSWLISTRGSGGVTGVSSFAAQDILRFVPTSVGTTTAGSWSLYADMSDVGITSKAENITAIDVAADGRMFLTTGGNASASTGGTSLSATNEDVFVFQPTALGSTTSGSYPSPLFFDGSLYGLGSNALLGIDVPV